MVRGHPLNITLYYNIIYNNSIIISVLYIYFMLRIECYKTFKKFSDRTNQMNVWSRQDKLAGHIKFS